METFELALLQDEQVATFKHDMQEAFQRGAEAYFGAAYGEVLPERDIDESLAQANSVAYAALVDGQMIGGAIISTSPEGTRGDLEFLYVKTGTQSRGVGSAIWEAIESRHPEELRWETLTPYFDRRNVYFYLNVCGFHAVEFLRDGDNPRLDGAEAVTHNEGMLRFEKVVG